MIRELLKRAFGRTIGTHHSRSGFTLIELLVSITIIGLMSTAGLVAFSTVRSKARDAKRMADIRQVQTAIEIYFESHSFYPPDKHLGVTGLIVGDESEAIMLSDGGFSQKAVGAVYMSKLPANPLPYGAPYVYRSLNRDGSDCNSDHCDSYVLLFWLERGQGDFEVGPHSLSPIGIAQDDIGYEGQDVVIGGSPEGVDVEATFDRYATETVRVVKEVRSDDTVQQVTEKAVAPTVGIMAVVNTVAATGSQLYQLFFFMLQPFQLLRRKRRRAWGVVYNSLSHLPEDLAIVRLHDSTTKRLLKSQVTDIKGRFSFLVGPGSYLITVSKVGYSFPSAVVSDIETDGIYENVYEGGIISVEGEGTVITPNIPIDPPDAPDTFAAIKKKKARGKMQRNIATLAFGLGIVAFAMNPTMLTGLLLTAQLVVYMLFKRLAEPEEPKNWGVVYDSVSEDPIPKAIVRIFEGKYNKLLETQVTDKVGRYHFRVGQNVYYITVTKPGYQKTETNKLDLTGSEGVTVIASDLPLQREKSKIILAKDTTAKTKTGLLVPPGGKKPTQQVPDSLKSSSAVGATPAAPSVIGAKVNRPADESQGNSGTVSIDSILPQMVQESVPETNIPDAIDNASVETETEEPKPPITEPVTSGEPKPPITEPVKPEESEATKLEDGNKAKPPMPDMSLISPSLAGESKTEPEQISTDKVDDSVKPSDKKDDKSAENNSNQSPGKPWFRD